MATTSNSLAGTPTQTDLSSLQFATLVHSGQSPHSTQPSTLAAPHFRLQTGSVRDAELPAERFVEGESLITSFDSIETARDAVLQHPVYNAVTSLPRVQVFMKYHVFAVWDFMSLLKRLQRSVTCVDVPWMPPADSSICRFINEIALGEESDEDGRGGYASHFELYLSAMNELGADTAPIAALLAEIRRGIPAVAAVQGLSIPDEVKEFVSANIRLASDGPLHGVAAAFFHGREDLIPEMFQRILPTLQNQGTRFDRMRHYLQRHIDVDGDQHGPLAQRLLDGLCDHDPIKVRQSHEAACIALRRRYELWNAIHREIVELPA